MPDSDDRQILRWEDGRVQRRSDSLAEEEPLEIRVRGQAITITMRTPGHDDELAAGFLLTEGVIHSPSDILKIAHCGQNEDGNVLNVTLAPQVPVDLDRLTRHVFASSSCGLCGKATIEAIRSNFLPVDSRFTIDAATLVQLPDLMRSGQTTFSRTGGLHAAALFDAAGRLLIVREDVGRHNGVDKVLGWAFLNGLSPLDHHILLVSGRCSFEIMQKALAGRVAVVAAVSAPSTLAVDFAAESGQTLVGFLREGCMNIYSHSARVQLQGASAPAAGR